MKRSICVRSLVFQSLLIISFSFIAADRALAIGFFADSTVFPSYSQTNTGALGDKGGAFSGTLNPESGFSYDLRNTLAFSIAPWVIIGASYNYAKASSKRDATDAAPSLDKKITNSEWGPSLGFLFGNFRLVGTYLVQGQKKWVEKAVNQDGTPASDSITENNLSSGYQLTLGYSFSIAPAFRVGPTLVYRHASYKTQTSIDNVNPDPAMTYYNREFTAKSADSELTPMISLMLSF